jgi:uncharacterized membrane protein YbhN (UPF0104 family)
MDRKRLSRVLSLIALSAIGFFIWWHQDELTSAALISPFYFGLCMLVTAGYLTANGFVSYTMQKQLGCQIQMLECLSLSVVSTGANVLTPMQGGAVVRAVYLKRRYNFDYSAFFATLIASQVLIVIVSSLFSTVSLAWILFIEHRPGLGALLTASTLCLVISVVACFWPRISVKGNRALSKVAEVTDSLYWLRARPLFLAKLAVLVGIQVGGQSLSFWTACAALGMQLGFVEATAIGALGTLASILSITPGSLGIYEAVVAFVGATLAVVPVQSIMAASVLRAVLIALLLVLTPLAISFLGKQAFTLARHDAEST